MASTFDRTGGWKRGCPPFLSFFWVLFLEGQEKYKHLGTPAGPNNVGRLGKGGQEKRSDEGIGPHGVLTRAPRLDPDDKADVPNLNPAQHRW